MATQVSPKPTWETYYNYARQLQDAGHKKQAEAYFRQAQLLFDQMEPQIREPYIREPYIRESNTRNKTTYSYTPPALKRMTLEPSVPLNRPSVIEFEESIPAEAPRSRKKSPKFWVITTLTLGLTLSVSGFIGLFVFYKHEVKPASDKAGAAGSDFGWIEKNTLVPMADVLRPAFDKMIRLSLAAQPLLYELNMRAAPPEDMYLETAHPSEGDERAVASNTEAIAPPEVEPEAANQAALTDPAAENADVPDARNDETGEDQAAPAGTVSASDVDLREDEKPREEKRASRSRSQRSRRRRSSRSGHAKAETEVTPAETKAIAPSPPPPRANAPMSEEESLIAGTASPKRNSRTQELDALLAPEAKPPRKTANRPSDKPTAKAKLDRSDVQRGMMRVAPAVKQCGRGKGGTIMLNVVIGQNGRVSSAVAAGIYSGTSIGSCASRAVRRAGFPASGQSLNVKYPFKL